MGLDHLASLVGVMVFASGIAQPAGLLNERSRGVASSPLMERWCYTRQ